MAARAARSGRPSKSVNNSAGVSNRKPFSPPDDVADAFMASNDLVRGLRGPFGSGKSVTCVHEILRRSQEQAPFDSGDGVQMRRTRWAVVRNTFPELKLTTVKTWLQWVPEALGPFLRSTPYTHHLHYRMPDGTTVDSEVIFLALDSSDDVAKLLSLELTGCWINEAREVPKDILDALTGRINRYPSPVQGGPSWSGIIMDTNSPGEEHWWPIMAGDVEPPEYMTDEEQLQLVKPTGWSFYTQPPAMLEVFDDRGKVVSYTINSDRANKALPDKYYLDMLAGKSRTWINIYILNRYETLLSGKLVYVDWSDELHIAKEKIEPDPNHTIYVGMDYGRTPAAIFLQNRGDQFFVFHEYLLAGVSTATFARMLVREIARRGWAEFNFEFWGDPSGDDMKETSDMAPSQIMRANKINAKAASTNDPLIRIESVSALLVRMTPTGPAMQVSPSCHTLIAGFRGGYHFKPIGGIRTGVYDTRPSKNRFSHSHDGLQYGVIGAGGWRPVMIGGEKRTVTVANRGGSPFARQAERSRGVSRWRKGANG